jgi:hypothetical protein
MAAEWLLQTLSHLWRLLQSLEVPAALMGGLAVKRSAGNNPLARISFSTFYQGNTLDLFDDFSV